MHIKFLSKHQPIQIYVSFDHKQIIMSAYQKNSRNTDSLLAEITLHHDATDETILIANLKQAKKDLLNKIANANITWHTTKIILLLPSDLILQKTIASLNQIKPKNLHQLVALNLEQYFSLKPNEAFFDYKIIPDGIWVRAISKTKLQEKLALLAAAKIESHTISMLDHDNTTTELNFLATKIHDYKSTVTKLACLMIVTLLLIKILVTFDLITKNRRINQQLEQTSATLIIPLQEAKKRTQEIASANAKLKNLQRLKEERLAPVKLMQLLANNTPTTILLKQLTLTPKQLLIQGEAQHLAAITLFLQNLSAQNSLFLFSDVTLLSTQKLPETQHFAFNIKAIYGAV